MSLMIAYITCPEKEAASLCTKILEARLAACINQIPKVISRYHWKGQIEEDEESLLMLKTSSQAVEQIKKKLKEWHSYEVPELIAVPIEAGLPEYLNWLQNEMTTQ